MRSVSPLVDSNFIAEVETFILTAGHDVEKLHGVVSLDVSRDGDQLTQMAGTPKAIRAGDMIMRDANGICCSIIYGQDNRSPISHETSRVLYVAYAPGGVPAATVEAHLRAIEENARLFSPTAVREQQHLLLAQLVDALVIVDMQIASFADGAKHDVSGVVHRINLLSSFVRGAGGIVVFIQHDGTEHEGLLPNTPGWQVLPTLEVRPVDLFIRKTLNDAFAGTLLRDELLKRSVNTLGVAGWATDYCVDSTIRSAVSRGFRVVVPSDAHTVSDRAHLTAPQIIDHHNRTWAGLIAKPPVHVAPTGELLARVCRD